MRLLASVMLIFCASFFSDAQVRIGSPAGTPPPSVLLELMDTTRGFKLPQLTQTQMNNIASPVNGLMIYNSTANSIYQYYQPSLQWKPIIADSSEWFFDPSSAKLYLRRALNNADSFYYNTSTKKFVFADSRYYTTSSGGSFNLDEGNSDRFIFKTTASRYLRPYPNLFSANVYSVYNVDNDTQAVSHPFEAGYIGMAADVGVTPDASQRISELYGVRTLVASGGKDSVAASYGLFSNVTVRGKGYHDLVYGINNSVTIRDSATNIGLLYGIQNRLSYSSPLGVPHILGDMYGYFGSFSTAFNNRVDGNVYGIFLGSVTAGTAGHNYSIFTGKGAGRLGDSVLITDISSLRPRAVLDVNSTSAMIIPAGTTAQRPVTGINGMLRYNSDVSAPEAYTSTGWVNLKPPSIISVTSLVDPPLIVNNTTGTVNITVTGAAIGNTVTLSPATAMPSGILVAWANVSAANTVTIGFTNVTGASTDPAALNFYIKVIQ